MNLEELPRLSLFVIAWFVMDRVVPLMVRVADRLGLYDHPRDYKVHERPIPHVGGLCIYLAFCAAIFATLRIGSFEENRPLFGILLGGFFVMVFGLLDDLRPIHAGLKLAMIAAVTYLVHQFGVSIQLVGTPWADTVLTILWVAGVTSAMNSLDNWDGVAAGVAAVAASFTFLVAWPGHPTQAGASYFALALLGCTLGFLGHNYPPAKIFLGNNGAFLLGFLLACLAVVTGWSKHDALKAVVIPCAILVVPLYDITLSTVLRIVEGRVRGVVAAVVYCGRDHLAHRISRQFGLGRRATVHVLYGLAIVGGGFGYVIAQPRISRIECLVLTGLAILALVAVGTILARAPEAEEPVQSVGPPVGSP